MDHSFVPVALSSKCNSERASDQIGQQRAATRVSTQTENTTHCRPTVCLSVCPSDCVCSNACELSRLADFVSLMRIVASKRLVSLSLFLLCASILMCPTDDCCSRSLHPLDGSKLPNDNKRAPTLGSAHTNGDNWLVHLLLAQATSERFVAGSTISLGPAPTSERFYLGRSLTVCCVESIRLSAPEVGFKLLTAKVPTWKRQRDATDSCALALTLFISQTIIVAHRYLPEPSNNIIKTRSGALQSLHRLARALCEKCNSHEKRYAFDRCDASLASF